MTVLFHAVLVTSPPKEPWTQIMMTSCVYLLLHAVFEPKLR